MTALSNSNPFLVQPTKRKNGVIVTCFYFVLLFSLLYGYYEREAIIAYFSGSEGTPIILYQDIKKQEDQTPTRTVDESGFSNELDGTDLKTR